MKAAAKMNRHDYAVSAIASAPEIAVEIMKPIKIEISMRAPYAQQMLTQMRDAIAGATDEDLAHPDACAQFSIDCPVKILMDIPALKQLIAQLEEGLK